MNILSYLFASGILNGESEESLRSRYSMPGADPGETARALELLKSGGVRMEVIPSNHQDSPTWDKDLGCHCLTSVFDKTSGEAAGYSMRSKACEYAVRSPVLIDRDFMKSIEMKEGETMFVHGCVDAEEQFFEIKNLIRITDSKAEFCEMVGWSDAEFIYDGGDCPVNLAMVLLYPFRYLVRLTVEPARNAQPFLPIFIDPAVLMDIRKFMEKHDLL